MDGPPDQVLAAKALYKEYWSQFDFSNYLPDWEPRRATFDGEVFDLDALAFCEYEVGFPDEDWSSAALIWAQVMVVSGEAQWLEPINGQIAICGPNSDYPWCVFFPVSRVSEMRLRQFPQFDRFATLTDLFVLQLLHVGYEVESIPKLCRISLQQEYDSIVNGASTFTILSDCMKDLAKFKKR